MGLALGGSEIGPENGGFAPGNRLARWSYDRLKTGGNWKCPIDDGLECREANQPEAIRYASSCLVA